MHKRILGLGVVATFLAFVSHQAQAADLLGVYNLAYQNDPTFKAAQASWLASKENLSIGHAALLPQLTAAGDLARINYDVEGLTAQTDHGGTALSPSSTKFTHNVTKYSLTLTQPIFNFASWAGVWGAQAMVKQAEASYFAALQSLIYRTATAYFNVLQAKDVLRFTQAKKNAIGRQLEETKHKYEVGLIAITDYETAKASYDAQVAAEIAAANDEANKLEQLTEITGTQITDFSEVDSKTMPLVSPQPEDIEQWVKAAEKQNYDLSAARFASIAARENIKAQLAGHLPVITAQGSYGYNYDNNNSGFDNFMRQKTTAGNIAISLPLFSGGAVMAQTSQAQYQYQQATAQQEFVHRGVISQTRQAYLGVMSGISKIKADRQAVVSNQSALTSTEIAFSAGMRTMYDVLIAQTTLYDTEKNHAQDLYAFILQTLTLKRMAGILDLTDVKKINTWLVKPQIKKAEDSGKDKIKATALDSRVRGNDRQKQI